MVDRALIAVMLAGAALVLAEVGERFHPLALVGQAIAAQSCEAEGWSREACEA